MKEIFDFIKVAEKLKCEMRHSWLSNGRQESVAEHSWRLSLMLILLQSKLPSKFNMSRALKMSVVHDLVEIYAGDVPVFEFADSPEEKRKKKKTEADAMDRIVKEINSSIGLEIKDLWLEYEDNSTLEAKVVKALDKLEAQLQHNQGGLATWAEIEFELTFKLDKYTDFNNQLSELKDLIVEDALILYEAHGIRSETFH